MAANCSVRVDMGADVAIQADSLPAETAPRQSRARKEAILPCHRSLTVAALLNAQLRLCSIAATASLRRGLAIRIGRHIGAREARIESVEVLRVHVPVALAVEAFAAQREPLI